MPSTQPPPADKQQATALAPATVRWSDGGVERQARWRSEGGWPAPETVAIADEKLAADEAFRLVSAGTALLWRGDFQAARQLLSALGTRIDKRNRRAPRDLALAFRQHREQSFHRARLLSLLLVPLDADYTVLLRRAPQVADACSEAYGAAAVGVAASGATRATPVPGDSVVALRELLGVIGAHEWRRRGVEVPELDVRVPGEPARPGRIHPHYGVFSPVRGEYLELVATAPLPADAAEIGRAVDVGTGTGVIAAILAHRGIRNVTATDLDARAIACARENVDRLGYARQVEVVAADLFAPGLADLIVCNPPWLPAEARIPSDYAVYDPDSQMLRGFLGGLRAHLNPGGEGWLIISDLAERLGLRSRGELLDLIEDSGLRVIERHDTRPTHARSSDASDPLHAARAREITSLWRLGASA
ncbi:methyltransferase family protein [Microterricola gilva]|uniref:Methyltransferase family protein n=1 Tax=Microterricola gilva TaxID=393267 RepID=A0A4Q8AIT6_9MICO|nr:class I SAM-dependent methyltransferase [Microterricola gilva]RZU63763.1 methyltransferase family protein [Microterricola gilva]